MNEGTKKIIMEYKSSTGEDVSFGNAESVKKLLRWYKQRRKLVAEYRDFLIYNGFDVNSPLSLEVGTNQYNSILLPYKASILTKSKDFFDKDLHNRVIEGGLAIKDDELCIVKNTLNGPRYIKLNKGNFDTFVMQNILDEKVLENWEDIHNLKLGNIVLGAFGNNDDKDRIHKLTMLKKLRRRLADYDYLEDHFVDDEMYLYVLGSSPKI